MSAENDDLFADSDEVDTDDLIADAKSAPVKSRLKKKGGNKKRKRDIPDADNDSDSDDDGAGLFDSDSDDEPAEKKPAKKTVKKKSAEKPMSKKERMEALQKRRRKDTDRTTPSEESSKPRKEKGSTASGKEGSEKGYDSGDSYNSITFRRTQEDDDFIDAEGEDPEALKELYAEQHFDDERPDGEESEDDEGKKIKKPKKGGKARRKGPDALSDDDLNGDTEPDNPIMAAVYRMKKKKKEAKKLSELEEDAKAFLQKMDDAAQLDETAILERRPATKKLVMLPEVLDMLAKREMWRPLLDFDLLAVCKRWIQPLRNGQLGNVTVRQRLLDAIAHMTGDNGVNPHDLKRSAFGKTLMTLYMHKSETPQMKRQHKKLIEQWSRPIFQKSGNMRDLQRVRETRGESGLVAISRAQQQDQAVAAPSARASGRTQEDLTSIIAKGYQKGAADLGSNRVRVPFSKGFQYTVQPTGKTGDVSDKRMVQPGKVKENRGNLNKRMIQKGRPVSKNQRSANISIEGRPTK